MVYWNYLKLSRRNKLILLNNNTWCIETNIFALEESKNPSWTTTHGVLKHITDNFFFFITNVEQQHMVYWNWLSRHNIFLFLKLNNNTWCIETMMILHIIFVIGGWTTTHGVLKLENLRSQKHNLKKLNNNTWCIETLHFLKFLLVHQVEQQHMVYWNFPTWI